MAEGGAPLQIRVVGDFTAYDEEFRRREQQASQGFRVGGGGSTFGTERPGGAPGVPPPPLVGPFGYTFGGALSATSGIPNFDTGQAFSSLGLAGSGQSSQLRQASESLQSAIATAVSNATAQLNQAAQQIASTPASAVSTSGTGIARRRSGGGHFQMADLQEWLVDPTIPESTKSAIRSQIPELATFGVPPAVARASESFSSPWTSGVLGAQFATSRWTSGLGPPGPPPPVNPWTTGVGGRAINPWGTAAGATSFAVPPSSGYQWGQAAFGGGEFQTGFEQRAQANTAARAAGMAQARDAASGYVWGQAAFGGGSFPDAYERATSPTNVAMRERSERIAAARRGNVSEPSGRGFNMFDVIMPMFTFAEFSHATQMYASTGLQAAMAQSPEQVYQAQIARGQAIGQGIVGSTAMGIYDFFAPESGPSAVMREYQQLAGSEQRLDRMRMMYSASSNESAMRRAYDAGGGSRMERQWRMQEVEVASKGWTAQTDVSVQIAKLEGVNALENIRVKAESPGWFRSTFIESTETYWRKYSQSPASREYIERSQEIRALEERRGAVGEDTKFRLQMLREARQEEITTSGWQIQSASDYFAGVAAGGRGRAFELGALQQEVGLRNRIAFSTGDPNLPIIMQRGANEVAARRTQNAFEVAGELIGLTGGARSSVFGQYNMPHEQRVNDEEYAGKMRLHLSDPGNVPATIAYNDARMAFVKAENEREVQRVNSANYGAADVSGLLKSGDTRAAIERASDVSRFAELARHGGLFGAQTRKGINERYDAQLAQQLQEFDDRRAAQLSGLDTAVGASGLRAEGRYESARAAEVEGGTMSAIRSLRGPDADRQRDSILQIGINEQKERMRTLQLQPGSYGTAAAPAAVLGPGYDEQKPNTEALEAALRSLQESIERLTASQEFNSSGSDF